MRRRGRTSDDSLELLLDTITNAFGGIVFLAMLVVILLRSAAPAESKSSPTTPDPTSLALQLEEARSELETLQRQREADDLVGRLTDPQLNEKLRELERLRQQLAELRERRASLTAAAASSEATLSEMQGAGTELDRDLASAQSKVDDLRDELSKERASRKISSPFPEERSTSKNTFNVTIRYGRWYVDFAAGGEPNLDDFAVLDEDGDYLTVTPKPYRGVPIGEGESLPAEIVRQLVSKPPSTYYVSFSIWDDSFDEFQTVRDALVADGYEYRLVVVTEGDEVFYGSVVDPKVQ